MKLTIYSLKKTLYAGEASAINCKTASGEITVLDHHRPIVSVLQPGTVHIVDSSKKDHYIPVQSGFLEVKNTNEARLLVEEQ